MNSTFKHDEENCKKQMAIDKNEYMLRIREKNARRGTKKETIIQTYQREQGEEEEEDREELENYIALMDQRKRMSMNITKLSQVFGASVELVEEILFWMQNSFTFNNEQHITFDKFYNETWKKMDLQDYDNSIDGRVTAVTKSELANGKKMFKRKRIDRKNEWVLEDGGKIVQVARIDRNTKNVVRFLFQYSTFVELITMLFTATKWTESVTKISDIPPSVFNALKISKDIRLWKLFSCIEGSDHIDYYKAEQLPYFLHRVVCTNRLVYHNQAIDHIVGELNLVKYNFGMKSNDGSDSDSDEEDRRERRQRKRTKTKIGKQKTGEDNEDNNDDEDEEDDLMAYSSDSGNSTTSGSESESSDEITPFFSYKGKTITVPRSLSQSGNIEKRLNYYNISNSINLMISSSSTSTTTTMVTKQVDSMHTSPMPECMPTPSPNRNQLSDQPNMIQQEERQREEDKNDDEMFNNACLNDTEFIDLDQVVKITQFRSKITSSIILDEKGNALTDWRGLPEMKRNVDYVCESRAMIGEYHPYGLSCVIFTMSAWISHVLETEDKILDWPVRRVYFFLKDFLIYQTKLYSDNPHPQRLLSISQSILLYLSGVRHKHIENQDAVKYMNELLEFYKYSHFAILKQRRSDANRILRSPTCGKLVAFRQVSSEEFDKLLSQNFYSYYSPHQHQKVSVMRCPCGKKDCNSKILAFDRKQVSPLQLFTSLEILKRHFIIRMKRQISHHEKCQLWSIYFTEKETFLCIEGTFMNDIMSKFTPYLLTKPSRITRIVPFPVSHIHMHNYFYGDNFALVISMKFILSTFCSGKNADKTSMINHLMPRHIDDPLIDFYRILHIILSRFSGNDRIWDELIYPLKNHEYLWFASRLGRDGVTKKSLVGIKEDVLTIYSALRAFILVNGQHFIMRSTLARVYDLFMADLDVQDAHPEEWNLVKFIWDNRKFSDQQSIAIPLDFFKDSDQFPIPPHLLLYSLACSERIPDKLATEIFLGISVQIGYAGNYGTTADSTRMRFSSMKISGMRARSKIPALLQEVSYRYKLDLDSDIPNDTTDSLRSPLAITRASNFIFLMQALEELSQKPVRHIKTPDQIDTDPTYRGNTTNLVNMIPLGARELLVDIVNVEDHAMKSKYGIPPPLPIELDTRIPEMPNVLPKYAPKYEETNVWKPTCAIPWNSCFPIWSSTLHEVPSYVPDDKDESCCMRKPLSIIIGELDARPFFGAHNDLLECVILQPIVQVDAIPKWDAEALEEHHDEEDGECSLHEESKICDSMELPIDVRITSPKLLHTSDDEKVNQDALDKRIEAQRKKFLYITEDIDGWLRTNIDRVSWIKAMNAMKVQLPQQQQQRESQHRSSRNGKMLRVL